MTSVLRLLKNFREWDSRENDEVTAQKLLLLLRNEGLFPGN